MDEVASSTAHVTKEFVSPDRVPYSTPKRPSKLSKSPKPKPKSLTSKDRFNSKFPHININYYTDLTKSLLSTFYPKYCPSCNVVLTKEISTRENSIRCPKCNYQSSRTVGTPYHQLKIPLWTASYILVEAIQRFPLGLSASEICRKLCVSKNTGTLLKRRLQVFLSDMIPSVKALMVEDIKKAWKGGNLPESGDLSDCIKGKPVVHVDTLALFSATQRSNGFLARRKHSGQTSSIYLIDKVAEKKGKYQIGSLCFTAASKGKGILLFSVPDQKQSTIQPLLDFLPKNTPLFSDEGFPFLSRSFKNHKTINHSARAKNGKRNVWARDRWSKNSVSNAASDGTQRSVKYSFLASYNYFRPESSQLFLNEFSALKAIRVYGLERLLSVWKDLEDSSRIGKKGKLANVGIK
ncbi:transposase [Leptospira stimsonii]|uniref:transposase n=1 Tax=Leptospira stimsonii TaxID=2202203 RepID=UPI001F4DA212|nr:transposase [Leptospira stimsonii]